MNFGNTLLVLRKKRNVTQEELAAELGVTAAAVSKWENGYSLPDLLMLCAIADYFKVSTDTLLGRNAPAKFAVIATSNVAFGKKVRTLAEKYGITVANICKSYAEAVSAASRDARITHLFISLERPLSESELNEADGALVQINVNCSDEEKSLESYELCFRNLETIEALGGKGIRAKRMK